MTASSVRHKIAYGITRKALSNYGVIGLGLITSVVLNRWYGLDQYGLLVMAFTVTSLATTFAGLGSQPTINRYIPRHLEEGQSEDAAALVMVGGLLQTMGIILFGGLILLAARPVAIKFFHRNDLVVLIKVGLFAFAGLSAFNFVTNLYQALEEWRIEALLSVLYPALYLVGVLLAMSAGWGIWAVLAANGFGALVTVAVGWWWLPSAFKGSLRWRLDGKVIRDHIQAIVRFGFPILFVTGGFFVYTWFDKALLGRYSGSEILAYYYIATLFYTALMIILKTLATVFMPHVAGLSPGDNEEMEHQYTIIFRSFLHVAILFSLVAFWWIGPTIRLFYGSAYAPTIWAFRWLLVIFLIRAAINPCGMFLQNVFGHTKKQAVFSAVLTIAFVLFAVFLIPSYGIMGAILAGINSYIIWWALLLIFAPEIRVLLPLATIRKTALIGVALLLPLLLLRGVDGGLALTLGAVFPIAYVAGLKVMGEIDKSDWDLMNSLLTSIRGRAPETVA